MNKVTCLTCNTTIESTRVYDFHMCPCYDTTPETVVGVDGGNEYRERVFGTKARWLEHDADGTFTVVDRQQQS